MESFILDMFDRVPVFLLILLRISGFIVISPIFGRRNIPAALKFGFALLLTYALILTVPYEENSYLTINLFGYGLKCMNETLLGAAIGYVNFLFFSAVLIAGEWIDTNTGFGMVNIFDPYINTQMPLMGNFLNMLLILVFFAVDGHHWLIRMLNATFINIPPGDAVLNTSLGLTMVNFFVSAFLLGAKIAMPVIAVALISEAALAIIMRTVPQMNVFVVGIPLKVMLGLFILMLTLPLYKAFFGGLFDDMNRAIIKTIQGFA